MLLVGEGFFLEGTQRLRLLPCERCHCHWHLAGKGGQKPGRGSRTSGSLGHFWWHFHVSYIPLWENSQRGQLQGRLGKVDPS